ncbi:MAG: ribonuclease III [Lachnospiraceae bacterium]|nr:ribonuclease III [Lachnospiraceae bacterium]
MEQNWYQFIEQEFGVEPKDIRTYSPLTLAYIGDGVFDLIIRSVVVGKGNTSPNKLHQFTSQIVKATTQSAMIDSLEDILSEEEMDVYRRGRNAKSHSVAKNASVGDYRKATGFEALIGYLYLRNQIERIVELILVAIDKCNVNL